MHGDAAEAWPTSGAKPCSDERDGEAERPGKASRDAGAESTRIVADEREQAVAKWREVMGFDPPPVSDPFMELTLDHVFGRIWTRPGLSRRERRLVSLTAAATAGQSEALGIHVSAALSSGDLSGDDLHEWVVQLAHYAGWPAGATAYGAVRAAIASQED